MKQRMFILAILLILSATAANSQVPFAPQNHFTIFGGLSMPSGDFGSASAGASRAGFARTGYCGGVEFVAIPMRNFEVGGMASINMNAIDDAAMENMWRQFVPNGSISSGSWMNISLMGSVGVNLPVSSIVDIYGRGYLGMMVSTEPAITITGNSAWATQNSATATSVGYGFGVGVRASSIEIALRLLSAEPSYELTARGSDGSSGSAKYQQPTTFFMFTIGYLVL